MRVLFAIGCDKYDQANALNGAEKDAKRVFEVLLKPEVGEYDSKRSKLLLSPTLEEVRQCLKSVLFTQPKIDVFTFFFAGHGGVSAGSFYMWVRDSSHDSQSMSALPLADIFRSLNEAAPQQSNIIIDACESGGLISDLSVLLKSNLLGNSGTPALTLIATSAQDQTSGETEFGGLGTNAILDCIEGRDYLQDNSSVLDLVEIGRRVSQRLETHGQTPVVWGLNLYGPPSFCRNPKFQIDPNAPLRALVQNWPDASDESIKINSAALWSSYITVHETWNAQSFLEVMRAVLDSSTSDLNVLAGRAERLATTFLTKASHSNEAYRPSQVAACLCVCLLPYLNSDLVLQSAKRLLTQFTDALLQANSALISDLSKNKYALLSKGGGLADLYQLPIRVTNVLGWAATCIKTSTTQEQASESKIQFQKLLALILENYSGSIVALCDAQAPYWHQILHSAIELDLHAEAEQIAGLIYFSLTECKAKLAKWDLDPARTLDYVIARQANDFSNARELVEQPIETLTVLLKFADSQNLGDLFDDSLWILDGVSLSAYIPSDYLQFGLPQMEGGESLLWSIGQDIFRTIDLNSKWPSNIARPSSPLEGTIAVIASLLNPDRVPWFQFEDSLTGP